MKKNNIFKFIAIAFLVTMTNGCSDNFLDRTPSGNYTSATFYASDDAVMKGIEPLYNRAWFDFNRRAIIGMGSYRANDGWNPYVSAEFARFQVTSLTQDMSLAWSSLYNVITMSNATLKNIKEYCSDKVTEEVKNQAMGECYLMRATAYFYLLRGWGANIIIEDNDKFVNNPIQPLNPEDDVLKFIIQDYRKAADLMRANIVNHHPSKYAAKALLAKALLAQSGWNQTTRDENTLKEVVGLCNEVLNSGKYSLMENYEDLFKAQNNDNSETLLAMRWADANLGTESGWGAINCLYSDLTFSEVTDVNVWGGNLTASVDMIDLYNEEPTDTFRLRATFFTPGRHYNYIKQAEGGYTYNHNWMQCKKGVLGTKADAGGHLAQMASPLNTYIQRLADVYLMKAEAILGNQDVCKDQDGLNALNAVRVRAGLTPRKSFTFQQLIDERRKEFCMEYFNWFDMVTWYRWKPQYMLDFFNNKQHRAFEYREGDVIQNKDGTLSYRAFLNSGTNAWYFTDADGHVYWNDHLAVSETDSKTVYFRGRPVDKAHGYVYDVDSLVRANANLVSIILNETNIFMPYPEADVLQNHYLKETPQPYNFGDDTK